MKQQKISFTKAHTIAAKGYKQTLRSQPQFLVLCTYMRRGGNRCRIYNTRVAALPLAAPILSCFDWYFVIFDEYNELADYNVSRHILDVHRWEEAAIDVVSSNFTPRSSNS